MIVLIKEKKMKVRGLVLHARREFVESNFGPGAWEEVLAALPAAERAQFKAGLYTTQWYPFDLGERLDKAIVDVLGEGRESVFEEIGIKSAQRNLSSVHQSFLRPGDPQAFMRLSSTIYRSYYDTGHRTYEQTGPCSGVITTYEAETFSVPDCLTVIGWYKEALRMCGAQNITAVEELCRARGDSCCRYRFEWEMA